MRERLGKFEVVRLLGKGAMGEVYLGRDPSLGREVALKVILSGSAFGEEAQARFEREARAAALLNHPHVVTVFEFGEDEGLHYLAMEYVQGQDLESLIQEGKTPKADLLEVLAQVCEGLAYAHEQGVIHRDIKPANVLVMRRRKRLHAKLMDFGVAHMGVSGLTQDGTWMGTVSYMAPEYLDSGKATIGSDLFALGVILYEILSGGRKPFNGDTATTVLNRILRQAPDPLGPEDLAGIPVALKTVVERALAKRPENRYPDADALAAAIREALEGPAASMADTVVIQKLPIPIHPQIRVGKGGQCLSLRVALRQAKPGMEIALLPGTYRESVVVDHDVRIVALGEPGEVVIEGVAAPPVVLSALNATLQNLTLVAPEGHEALRVEGGGSQLEGCQLKGGTTGVTVVSGAAPRFQACTIEGFQEAGLSLLAGAQAVFRGGRIGPGQGVGLLVHPKAQAQAENAVLSGASASVEVGGDGHVQLQGCRLVESAFAGLLALERSHAVLEACEISLNACSGVHVLAGAHVMLRNSRVEGNAGFGASVMDRGMTTLENCVFKANGGAGLLIHRGATVQARACSFAEGKSLGVDCSDGGQGVLDGCSITGNAGAGVQVEPGGSLLLVRCTIEDGRDTGLLLLEDSQATLEECVVHRNARGGVLLAKDAADPVMRGTNRIEDDFHRVDRGGNLIKVAPIQRN
ncbi:MAG TPA: right-handed parallel beta-helix repeat-containing protein [Geothrix sp.]|nr:right-handed parallel beta-helix repeat-containing protein [Geothrix sp.]